jgi:hypothetical protein
MSPRPLAWLLALPLAIAGSQAAHAASYALVEPHAHARADLLAETGHGYLEHVPLLLAACLAAAVLGAVWEAAARLRAPHAGAGALPYALLPPLAFTLQEHLERLAETGTFPLAAALEPTFLAGLALQAPFALAAWLAARVLLRTATRVVRRLAAVLTPRRRAGTPVPPAPAAADRIDPPRALLRGALAGRAPPVLTVTS